MPELPEVETVRARLQPVLAGRRLDDVRILDARLTRPEDPHAVAAELAGERVDAVERRGKYLLLRLASRRVLAIHLRMTGTMLWEPGPDVAHVRALLGLDDGSRVAYRDVRRFGTWLLLEPDEVDAYLAVRLGPEPLGDAFTPVFLRRRLEGRRAPLKVALLDQRTVAGLGNIYADEALWRARLHPRREAGALSRAGVARLHAAIRESLEVGIARRGSTLSDYRQPDGAPGSMQHEFKAYGRLGEPCERCGTPIERIVVGGRGTWYCPRCQRLPRRRPPTP